MHKADDVSRQGADVVVGNALSDQLRGWFVGQFLAPNTGLRHRHDVELKWGIHRSGERRNNGWSTNRTATTISILLEGIFVIETKTMGGGVSQTTLRDQGDYIIIKPGVPHSWYSVTDTVILTVRTPSVPNDQVHHDRDALP